MYNTDIKRISYRYKTDIIRYIRTDIAHTDYLYNTDIIRILDAWRTNCEVNYNVMVIDKPQGAMYYVTIRTVMACMARPAYTV